MKWRRMADSAALGLLAALAGCVGPSDQVWSTKRQSVVGETAPRLNVGSIPPEAAPSELPAAALDVLEQAVGTKDPLLRANAIEALHHAPNHIKPVVAAALVDENRGVRFVAAMTIGRLRLRSIAHLLEPLLRDRSESVQAAAIYGMARCGLPVDLNPLAELIESEDPEVRANAALVLGGLGNPSAVSMLRRAIGRGMKRVPVPRAKIVELQLAEAMVRLGAERELQVIRAALFAPPEQGEITALACQMCGRLNDRRAMADLIRIARRTDERRHPAEVRMAATLAIAQLEPMAAPVEVPMAYVASDRPELRAQAALTLGAFRDPARLPMLAILLSDEDPMVQVAAAGAILQIKGP